VKKAEYRAKVEAARKKAKEVGGVILKLESTPPSLGDLTSRAKHLIHAHMLRLAEREGDIDLPAFLTLNEFAELRKLVKDFHDVEEFSKGGGKDGDIMTMTDADLEQHA